MTYSEKRMALTRLALRIPKARYIEEPLNVEEFTYKDIVLTIGGPTCFIRFKFTGRVCDEDNLIGVSLHTNEIDYGSPETTMEVYDYVGNDMLDMFHTYEDYLMD